MYTHFYICALFGSLGWVAQDLPSPLKGVCTLPCALRCRHANPLAIRLAVVVGTCQAMKARIKQPKPASNSWFRQPRHLAREARVIDGTDSCGLRRARARRQKRHEFPKGVRSHFQKHSPWISNNSRTPLAQAPRSKPSAKPKACSRADVGRADLSSAAGVAHQRPELLGLALEDQVHLHS